MRGGALQAHTILNSPKHRKHDKENKWILFSQKSLLAFSGTVIFQAQVQDNDTGIHGSLKYELETGNEQGKFYLDAVSGRLILVSQLDRETLDHYNITIVVQDDALQESDIKRSNVTVYINVLDVNDNEPRCTPSLYSVDISESKN